jgi:malonate transporter
VLRYALPLNLFAGMINMSSVEVLSQDRRVVAILLSMVGSYAATLVMARYLFRRDLAVASLQALAIGAPSVNFVGVSVLGNLFGTTSTVPISAATLALMVVEVPVTMMLLSASTDDKEAATGGGALSFVRPIIDAPRQPVVWSPLLALVLVLFDVQFPSAVRASLFLLGNATGGVALFASGIILYWQRVTISLPMSIFSTLLSVATIGALIWRMA